MRRAVSRASPRLRAELERETGCEGRCLGSRPLQPRAADMSVKLAHCARELLCVRANDTTTTCIFVFCSTSSALSCPDDLSSLVKNCVMGVGLRSSASDLRWSPRKNRFRKTYISTRASRSLLTLLLPQGANLAQFRSLRQCCFDRLQRYPAC